MKKIKQAILLSICVAPAITWAAEAQPFTTTVGNVLAAKGATTAQTVVQGNNTMIISPRTGIRYALGDTQGRAIVIQTAAIAPVNNVTVKRIIATNPALSVESQQKAEQSSLSMNQATH